MGGVGHDFKTGVNFINEPTLYVEFSTLKGVAQYTHLTDSVSGPISDGHASTTATRRPTSRSSSTRSSSRTTGR